MKNLFLLLLLLNFSFIDVSDSNFRISLNKINSSYHQEFISFQKEVDLLHLYVNEDIDIKSLRKQLTKTRNGYKKIEFIYDYLNTNFNYYNINGAPLPKFSQSYTNNKIAEPNGLQTLDELIFGENPLKNIDEIKSTTELLKEKVDLSSEIHFPTSLNTQQVFEAIRSGLIRMFTLGVTGFDTPSSNNALTESYTSIESIENYFELISRELQGDHQTEKEISKLFNQGIEQLKSTVDFDSFDRLKLLKEVINPLYKLILDYQKSAKIDTENLKRPNAQNFESENLFDENFINSNFYSYRSYIPLNNKNSVALGRQLFFDTSLSKNNKMSCSTCHNPNKGFADGLPKSPTNTEGIFTDRNTPTVIDAGLASRQFWDMREYNLELQVAHVVGNGKEFNNTFGTIIKQIEKNPNYSNQFKDIYGEIDEEFITKRTISNAIAAFVSSLKSFNSEFDKYIRNETNEYPENAYRGFNLFTGKAACATCHFSPIFNGTVPPFYTETESEVLGVTDGFNLKNPILDADLGRIANNNVRDNLPYFKNSFKTVSLRNAGITAPYMHNGSFNTLEEVLEFYNVGGGNGMGLNLENQTLSDTPLNLTEKEIDDIIAFLHTLTDTTTVTSVTKPARENYILD